MKPGIVFAAIAAVAVIAFGVYMIDFDTSGELAAPDVDVSVEGGEVPEVDADVGDVDVGTEEVTVEVPDVDVTPPEDDGVVETDTSEN